MASITSNAPFNWKNKEKFGVHTDFKKKKLVVVDVDDSGWAGQNTNLKKYIGYQIVKVHLILKKLKIELINSFFCNQISIFDSFM